MQHNRSPGGSRSQSAQGFTLIEVLISLVILSIGLLGLGLLQADSLKASFSADQRTIATNMAYQMVDMMRANRVLAFEYTYITGEEATQNPNTCNRAPTTGNLINDDSFGWLCQLVRQLPNAVPVVTLAGGQAQVAITWDDRGPTGATTRPTFTLVTQL